MAITAYSLDNFPAQAAGAAAWINMFRAVAGFAVNYFRISPLHLNILIIRIAMDPECRSKSEFWNASGYLFRCFLVRRHGPSLWKVVSLFGIVDNIL